MGGDYRCWSYPPINDFIFFFIVALVVSWAFLRLENQSLISIGFIPNKAKYWKQFLVGACIGILMFIVTSILVLWLTGEKWELNKHISPVNLAVTLFMILWSAFVQEFVFRGYPFQTLLKHYGPWIAQISVAIPFGLMHVNRLMTPQDIARTMLTTGVGSILFGLGYIKTRKLLLPIGLHFGWNYTQTLMPRAPANQTTGILTVISTNKENYGFFNVLMPYLVVMIATIVIMAYFRKNKGRIFVP